VLSPTATSPQYNGAIHTVSYIMRNVMASYTEADLDTVFRNAREGVSLRIALEEMGHPQAATSIQTENACAAGIANEKVKQSRYKAIEMRFYWIHDRIKQGKFIIHWRAGKTISPTTSPSTIHQPIINLGARNTCLNFTNLHQLSFVRGCVDVGRPHARAHVSQPHMIGNTKLTCSVYSKYQQNSS
jgi:hypothetical protein